MLLIVQGLFNNEYYHSSLRYFSNDALLCTEEYVDITPNHSRLKDADRETRKPHQSLEAAPDIQRPNAQEPRAPAEFRPTVCLSRLTQQLRNGEEVEVQIRSLACMLVMPVLLRTYRLLGIRDLPSTAVRSRLCRSTHRSKSSAQQSAPETPTSASKGYSKTSSASAKPASLDDVGSVPIDIPTSLWYQRLGPVTNFFRWFHRTQEKRPYTVQISTSLTVYLFGDLLAQDIGGEYYDPKRTLRMLAIGAIASVPGYKWLCEIGLL